MSVSPDATLRGRDGEGGPLAEVAAWTRLAEEATEENARLVRGPADGTWHGAAVLGTATSVRGGRAADGPVCGLDAAAALEVLLLSRRYLLPALATEATAQMVRALRASEVVPLLMTAQHECDDDALAALSEWAVAHFDDVAGQIDSWLACAALAPLSVRRLGDTQLADIREQLRVAMVRERYGL